MVGLQQFELNHYVSCVFSAVHS